MGPDLEARQKYALGIDLGSESLGWALIGLDGRDQPESLIRTGVRIFEPGVDGTALEIQEGKDKSKAVERRTVGWSYDGIYRLTNETISLAPSGKNGEVSYGLDPVGNRTSVTSTIPDFAPVSGMFNQDDELASENYDLNGNVTASGGKTFSYNSQNQLVSMNSGAVRIVYDGDGNRVAKTVVANGVPTTTSYLVDDLNPTGYPQVVEELQGGAVTRQYTYGLERIDENQLISNTWTPSFYGYDGGGNVRQLTNSAGTVTDTYEYDAYGNEFTVSGSTPNEMMYRGEQFDSDLGLYYLRARYYSPLTGRFMSRDPEDGNGYDPKTLHKYLYAGGDPVNAVDPKGRDLFEYAFVEGGSKSVPAGYYLTLAGIGTCAGGLLTTAGAILEAGSLSEFFKSPSATFALPLTLACPIALAPYLPVPPEPYP